MGDIANRPSYLPPLENGASETGLEDALPAEVRRILAYAEAEGNAVQSSLAAIELGRRCLDGRRPREGAGWARYATQRVARVASRHDRSAIRTQIDLLIGTALYQTGRMNAAKRRLARVAAAYEQLDAESQRKAFTYLGLLHCKTGRFSEARRTFEAGYDALNRLQLPPDQASILSCGFLNHLAWNELRRGDFDAAEQFLDKAALVLGDSPPGKSGRALAQLLTYRGLLRSGRGEYKGTVEELERALEVSRLHLPHTLKSAEGNLALALVHVGELGRAREMAARLYRIDTAEDDGPGQTGPLICLGNIAEAAAEWVLAVKFYEDALRLAEQYNNFNAVLSALTGLITAYEGVANSSSSDCIWTRAVTMQKGTLAPNQMGSLFLSRAAALARRGDWAAVEQITSEWGPTLSDLRYRREATAMEILGIRAALERLKDDQETTDSPGFPAEPALLELWRRLSALEGYLRSEGLRSLLVEFDRMQLHLALAGLREIRIDAVLQDLVEHLRFMEASARLAEIAEEFADTAISIRSLYRQVFEPSRSVLTLLRSQASSTVGSAGSASADVTSETTHRCTRILAFGPLRVIPAGGSEHLTRAQWASRRARVLLAFLLAKDLEGRGVTRDQIWEAVWPDSDSLDLANPFHITMVRLRAALQRGHDDSEASAIVFSDGRYRLGSEGIWCDAREFEREIRTAEKLKRDGRLEEAFQARQAAFDLYEGEFLADTDDIWAEARRERYRARFLESAVVLVEYDLKGGQFDDARRVAEKVLTCDPQSEEGHRLLTLIDSRKWP
jgi:DNA-binding SARP family transcriptional activator